MSLRGEQAAARTSRTAQRTRRGDLCDMGLGVVIGYCGGEGMWVGQRVVRARRFCQAWRVEGKEVVGGGVVLWVVWSGVADGSGFGGVGMRVVWVVWVVGMRRTWESEVAREEGLRQKA